MKFNFTQFDCLFLTLILSSCGIEFWMFLFPLYVRFQFLNCTLLFSKTSWLNKLFPYWFRKDNIVLAFIYYMLGNHNRHNCYSHCSHSDRINLISHHNKTYEQKHLWQFMRYLYEREHITNTYVRNKTVCIIPHTISERRHVIQIEDLD